jgi:hypothetical protein
MQTATRRSPSRASLTTRRRARLATAIKITSPRKPITPITIADNVIADQFLTEVKTRFRTKNWNPGRILWKSYLKSLILLIAGPDDRLDIAADMKIALEFKTNRIACSNKVLKNDIHYVFVKYLHFPKGINIKLQTF